MTLPNNSLQSREAEPIGDDVDLLPPPSPIAKGHKFGMPEGTMKIVLVSFVVTFVVLALMSFAGGVSFVTKKDFDENWTNMTASLDKSKADLVAMQTAVANAVQGIPSTISSAVSSSISQSTNQLTQSINQLSGQVSALSSTVDSNRDTVARLSGDITALEAEVTALQSQITSLETRIKALEDKKASGGTSTGTDTVYVKTSNYLTLSPTGVAGQYSATAFLEVKNDSVDDIEVTGLLLVVYPLDLSSGAVFSQPTVSATIPFNWVASLLGSNIIMIQGGALSQVGGVVIDSDESENVMMNLTLNIANYPSGGLSLAVKVNKVTFTVLE